MAADDDIILDDFDEPPAYFLSPPIIIVPETKCVHRSGIINGCCAECGKEIQQYTRRRKKSVIALSRLNSKVDPIIKFMQEWPYSDAIKDKALERFKYLGLSNLREEEKKELLCHCLFKAHVDLGIHTNVILIGKTIGLSSKVSQRSNRFNTVGKPGMVGFNAYVDPIEMMPTYGKILELSEDVILDMKENFSIFLERNPDMIEKPAGTLIASYIWYYLTYIVTAEDLNKDEFAEIFDMKFSTIKSHVNDIVKMENEQVPTKKLL